MSDKLPEMSDKLQFVAIFDSDSSDLRGSLIIGSTNCEVYRTFLSNISRHDRSHPGVAQYRLHPNNSLAALQ